MNRKIPRFQIIEQIGQGQFSNVYKARMICCEQTSSSNNNTDRRSLPLIRGSSTSTANSSSTAALDSDGIKTRQGVLSGSCCTEPEVQLIDLGTDNSGFDSKQNFANSNQQEQYVALKRIKFYEIQDGKMRSDCIKEVKLLQQLKHPNIIFYSISFIERNELYIVLELADGGDLSKLISHFQRKNMLLNEASILKYFSQVCSAVRYIHSKRILHRDIKPANIFMTSAGCVKLGDFGLGRFFGQNTRNAHSYVGTFYYMSPERIREWGYDFSSDVWSLGCVLYELITLYSPFSVLLQSSNNKSMEHVNPFNLEWIIDRIVRADYPSLAHFTNISPELRNLAHKCLSQCPSDRPNMEEICLTVYISQKDSQRRVLARTPSLNVVKEQAIAMKINNAT